MFLLKKNFSIFKIQYTYKHNLKPHFLNYDVVFNERYYTNNYYKKNFNLTFSNKMLNSQSKNYNKMNLIKLLLHSSLWIKSTQILTMNFITFK